MQADTEARREGVERKNGELISIQSRMHVLSRGEPYTSAPVEPRYGMAAYRQTMIRNSST